MSYLKAQCYPYSSLFGQTHFTYCHLLFKEPTIYKQCDVIMSIKHILIECPNFKSHLFYHFHSSANRMAAILGSVLHCNHFNFLIYLDFYLYIWFSPLFLHTYTLVTAFVIICMFLTILLISVYFIHFTIVLFT